ncbi:hypothetical protein ABEB36_009098 [Hypothenemus hampei]|uniref:Uncharacterized protein n=1 Tax=Hypothenemus hampei TaxID=57062 RepID=A0ABD1EP41_HYPHA
MFKLVVLSVLVAISLAKPSLYPGLPLQSDFPVVVPTPVIPHAQGNPIRNPFQNKTEVINFNVTRPVGAKPDFPTNKPIMQPIVPVWSNTIIAPGAVSNSYRVDIFKPPSYLIYYGLAYDCL